jgi:hippurate hydrolase
MLRDGLLDRFGIQEVFGMHNYPGIPVGEFAIRSGPMMASTDSIAINLEGKGGHAAWPHLGVDTVLVGAQIVNQIQSIVARNVDPLEAAVISICVFQAGQTDNVIPQHAKLRGTIRSLSPQVREFLQKRLREVVEGTARLYGAKADVTFSTGYPVLVNEEGRTAFAAAVADEIAGKDKVNRDVPPLMGAEDFAYMLQERPGAFIYLGNGDSAMLHHPAYDFNDEAIPVGTSYWVRLAETALAG